MENKEVKQEQKSQEVYVKVTDSINKTTGEKQKFVGFGALQPYEDEYGKEKKVNCKNIFFKVNEISSFLKSTDAEKVGITIKGNDGNKDVFYKASRWTDKKISNSGEMTYLNKITISSMDETIKLYATKTNLGWAFDINMDKNLIQDFNKSIENGCWFSLKMSNLSSFQKYPKLNEITETIKNSKNGYAYAVLSYENGKGVILKGINSENGKNIETNNTNKGNGQIALENFAKNQRGM